MSERKPHEFKLELDAHRNLLRLHRIAAFEAALRHAGYCEGSIEIAREKCREWIDSGRWTSGWDK